MTIREVKESPDRMGENERIAIQIDTTPWGGYTSGVANVLEDQYGNNVSTTNLSGDPSESGGTITTSLIIGLVPGVKYKLEISWVYSGNTLETFGYIIGEE